VFGFVYARNFILSLSLIIWKKNRMKFTMHKHQINANPENKLYITKNEINYIHNWQTVESIIYRNKCGLISLRNKKIVSYILQDYSIDCKCLHEKYFYLNIICKSFIVYFFANITIWNYRWGEIIVVSEQEP